MDHFALSPRRSLLRWIGWFFLINALIASLVLFGYLPQISTLGSVPHATTGSTIFGYVYFILTFITQCSFYMFCAAAVCAVVSLIFPWKKLVIMLGALLSAILLFALVADTVVFRLYHMHYAVLGWQVFQAGAFAEVMPLGLKEEMIILGALIVVVLLELILAMWLWRVFSKPVHKTANKVAFISVACSWVVVYGVFGLAIAGDGFNGGYRYVVLRSGRIAPYLSQIYIALFEKNKPVRSLAVGQTHVPVMLRGENYPLNYPLKPMACHPPKRKLNVVIIGVDTWRYTSMTKEISPNVYRFSRHALRFKDHYSGGNCTQPGLFSLFYGLPANYWDAFLSEQKSPVLVNQLYDAGYHVGIFLSAQSNFPHFDKTIFVKVKSLNADTPGYSSIARDKMITNEFVGFLKKQTHKKPFFSFLFYDALHNYCEPARPHDNPFQPAVGSCDRFSLDSTTPVGPYLNLYNNKMRFVDQQIARVLAALKKAHQLNNTIVMITADHGEQMNDEGLGLWGHASAYSSYQLHIPMIVYWPGKKPGDVHFETTHYDIAPTLLQSLLGCRNQVSDYAVGHSLFRVSADSHFVAGSYGDYAVVSPPKAVRIYPNGDYSVSDLQGRSKSQEAVSGQALQKVYQQLQAYYRHPLNGAK